MADSDKIVVEITKQEAPPKEPSFEWWICWRDPSAANTDFKCMSVDSIEQVYREVERLGLELAGRQIWVSNLISVYKSEIAVKMQVLPIPTAQMTCVN